MPLYSKSLSEISRAARNQNAGLIYKGKRSVLRLRERAPQTGRFPLKKVEHIRGWGGSRFIPEIFHQNSCGECCYWIVGVLAAYLRKYCGFLLLCLQGQERQFSEMMGIIIHLALYNNVIKYVQKFNSVEDWLGWNIPKGRFYYIVLGKLLKMFIMANLTGTVEISLKPGRLTKSKTSLKQ